MGLYNTLTLDSSLQLPNLDVKIDSWQTKDLIDDLGPFCDVHLNANGQLEMIAHETECVEDSDTAVEPIIYTGYISFYNSYTHPEYTPESEHVFVPGWYEYRAHFVDGLLTGGVDRIGYNEARKLSPEETAAARLLSIARKEQIRKEQVERRKNRPSAVEQLLDNIDALAAKPKNFIMPEMSDYAQVLKCISEEIKKYREKYDPWYEQYE